MIDMSDSYNNTIFSTQSCDYLSQLASICGRTCFEIPAIPVFH